MKAAIYTRISADQTGERLGVTRQLEECLALADRMGWEVVDRFDDNDLSAFNGKTRPRFEAMLDAMKRGEFGALLCWHTDRLYRSMKDLERLIEIADAAAVQIKTVQGGDLDQSTSAGRMVARILGSVARQESEHKGERHRAANAQKAAAGDWQTAKRPFGYTMTGEPLEPEATAFRTAVADILAGKSIRRVAVEWNAAGLRTTESRKEWNSPRVRRLLTRPRYAALKVYRGKVVGPGDWTPLIDVDTYHGLMAFLSDPARKTNTSFDRKYMGSGVYRCGRCGGPMQVQYNGGRWKDVRVYACRASKHVIRTGEPVDQYVSTLVLERLRRSDIHTLLRDGDKVDIADLQQRRAALQARLDDLAAMFAAAEIDASQLRRGTSELRVQLAGVDSVLADVVRTSPVDDLMTAGDAIAQRWEATTPDIKGKIVDELMTVTVLPSPRGTKGFHPEYIRIDWRTT